MTLIRETYARVLLFSNGAELRFDRHWFESVITKRKTTTIREGVFVFPRRCRLRLTFGSASARAEGVVRKCEIKALSEVSNEEAAADGFASVAELTRSLKQYYPSITAESVVTVIEFTV